MELSNDPEVRKLGLFHLPIGTYPTYLGDLPSSMDIPVVFFFFSGLLNFWWGLKLRISEPFCRPSTIIGA